MNKEQLFNWFIRAITGLGLLVSSMFAGIALGMLWVKLFVPPKAMGWDGLADALGGMMAGGLLGLIGGVLLIAFLSLRKQWMAIALAVIIAFVTFSGLVLTAPERPESSPVIIEKDFQPFYRVTLRVSHTEEILEAVPSDERPFPFVEAEIFTGIPELTRVSWGPDFAQCKATPSEADLEALLPQVQAIVDSAGPYCRTPEDDLSLSVTFNLAGNMGNQGLQTGCLSDKPAITTLADSIAVLADRLCESEPISVD